MEKWKHLHLGWFELIVSDLAGWFLDFYIFLFTAQKAAAQMCLIRFNLQENIELWKSRAVGRSAPYWKQMRQTEREEEKRGKAGRGKFTFVFLENVSWWDEPEGKVPQSSSTGWLQPVWGVSEKPFKHGTHCSLRFFFPSLPSSENVPPFFLCPLTSPIPPSFLHLTSPLSTFPLLLCSATDQTAVMDCHW